MISEHGQGTDPPPTLSRNACMRGEYDDDRYRRMAELVRQVNGGWVNPLDSTRTVTPEQVAASLARLEVEMKHLTSAIDRLTDHLDRIENRMSPLERIAERAQSAWWTMTKFVGVFAGCAGGAAWLLEHGSKVAMVMK